MLCLVILRPAPDEFATLKAYEDGVLPLLRDHGAALIRRVRGLADEVEAHLIEFPTAESRDSYIADPRRAALAPLWEASGATREVFEVADVWRFRRFG